MGVNITMSTLYELTGEYLTLLEMAMDEDIDPQALEDTLEGLSGEIEIKAENYMKVVKAVEMNINGCDAEIKRLQARKKTLEANTERIKKSLESAMKITGKVKFKTNLFSFNIQKNPPSLVIDDEKSVPPEFLIIKQEVNKTALKEAIKAGEEFEFAHLEQTEGLRVR